MDFINSLNWRYAVNKFSPELLSNEQLQPLIDSVHLSASSYGMQPYELIIISSEKLKQALLPYSYGQNKVAECSHLFVLANRVMTTAADVDLYIQQLANNQGIDASKLAGYQNTISNHLLSLSASEQAQWSANQCYIALGKLLSSAAINQIDTCPMTGFDNVGFNHVLGLSERGLNAEIICPVGVRSSEDHTAYRSKFRRPQDQMVSLL